MSHGRLCFLVLAGFITLASGARPSAGSCPAHSEEARWRNDDTKTLSLTRIELRFVCQDQMLDGEPYPPGAPWYVHVFGKCDPVDCDWGEVAAHRQEGGYVYAVYDHTFARRFLWIRPSKTRPGLLWVYMWTHFENSDHPDFAIQAWFRRE